MDTTGSPNNFGLELALAVNVEVAAVKEERLNTSNVIECGRLALSHYMEGNTSVSRRKDIDELGCVMFDLLEADPDARIHDASTERFDLWEVVGWDVGTTLLIKRLVIPEARQDEFFRFVGIELQRATPAENAESTISVNDNVSNAVDEADGGILLCVDQIRDLFDDQLGSDSLVDVDAFKRGLYFSFVLAQKFLSSQESDLDAEFLAFAPEN